MLTYYIWECYNTMRTQRRVVPPYIYVYTDEEVADAFLFNVVLTPFSLIGDILTLPFQLTYLISKKLITHIIKKQRR